MNGEMQSTDAVKRAGIVTVSLQLLQQLFGNECRVERAAMTDEDFARGTVSVVVTDHPNLPTVEPGQTIERVQCVMQRHEDGTVSVQSFHRIA